jgi:diguanylate cyclase
MLDIDNFKSLNDRYGHPAGDAVLRWLGGILRAASRKGDLVARYGGEEFAAILPHADLAAAATWAERLRRAINTDPAPGVDETVTVSMGVTTWRTGDSGNQVVARADEALYEAKRAGRDRVVVRADECAPFGTHPVEAAEDRGR